MCNKAGSVTNYACVIDPFSPRKCVMHTCGLEDEIYVRLLDLMARRCLKQDLFYVIENPIFYSVSPKTGHGQSLWCRSSGYDLRKLCSGARYLEVGYGI